MTRPREVGGQLLDGIAGSLIESRQIKNYLWVIDAHADDLPHHHRPLDRWFLRKSIVRCGLG